MNEKIGNVWIQDRIIMLRKQRVMLSTDLAELYEVQSKALLQSVRRNIERFPVDFMFQLSDQEFAVLRSQFVTAKWAMSRTPPYAFTEQGIAMLSSVLRSPKAIQVNIQIMREFVAIRKLLLSHQELAERINQLEARYDQQFRSVFDAIRTLIEPVLKPKRRIGIHSDET